MNIAVHTARSVCLLANKLQSDMEIEERKSFSTTKRGGAVNAENCGRRGVSKSGIEGGMRKGFMGKKNEEG